MKERFEVLSGDGEVVYESSTLSNALRFCTMNFDKVFVGEGKAKIRSMETSFEYEIEKNSKFCDITDAYKRFNGYI